MHEQCLDAIIRDRPQPEAIYRDNTDNSSVVIERKTFVWPLGYAKTHQAEHVFFDLIVERLGTATRDLPYALNLPGGISLNHGELRFFSDEIAKAVMPFIGKLEPGQGITSRVGQHDFRFWLQWSSDRDDPAPSTGLMIETLQHPSSELNDPRNLPKGLTEAIERAFQACARQFSEYGESRRILLIDQFGEMRYLDESWWQEVLARIPPPEEISEIWLGVHDFISEYEQGWLFGKLHPTVVSKG